MAPPGWLQAARTPEVGSSGCFWVLPVQVSACQEATVCFFILLYALGVGRFGGLTLSIRWADGAEVVPDQSAHTSN